MRDGAPRLLAALGLVVVAATGAGAQAGLGHLEDASTAPRGLLRVRAITAFGRYDQRFSADGVAPLGAVLSSDSLGVAQIPELATIQSLVETASGRPFLLRLGQSQLDATAREEITPLGLEYGISDRLSVNMVVPIIRRRVATLFRLTPEGFGVNVGPNPARTSTTFLSNNAQVQAEFANAAVQLQARLQSCQTNPGAPGCASVVGREAQAQQLIQSSESFANDLAALFGSATSAGMAFVPTSKSAAQVAIGLRVADFNTRYRDLLGAPTDLILAVPSAAQGPAGSDDLQRYVVDELGRDSLNTQERLLTGDVEAGFKFRVLDTRATRERRRAVQLSVAASLRWPTGSRQSPSDIVDLTIGSGSAVVDSRIFLDARAGRFGVLAAGQFAMAVWDKDTINASLRNSRWTELQVAPRWHVSEPFALHAAYSLRSTDQMGGDQLVGGGVSYSTLAAYRAGRRALPMEMRFTHLEAVHGDAGRPKFFRDQLEVRLYFRLR